MLLWQDERYKSPGPSETYRDLQIRHWTLVFQPRSFQYVFLTSKLFSLYSALFLGNPRADGPAARHKAALSKSISKRQLQTSIEQTTFIHLGEIHALLSNNVIIKNIESNKIKLIKYYDDHNIFILPSFTEGHPMALLESLARRRPVVIFEDIDHVIEKKKGIFV